MLDYLKKNKYKFKCVQNAYLYFVVLELLDFRIYIEMILCSAVNLQLKTNI